MSNGYLVAATADVSAAHEISDGFGLDVIDANAAGEPDTAASALAAVANIGIVISPAAAADEAFVALLRALAQRLERAQLILIGAEARAVFAFLPEAWPAMSIEDARARSAELVRRRDGAPGAEPEHAAPLPPVETPEPEPAREQTQSAAPEATAAEPIADEDQESYSAPEVAEPPPDMTPAPESPTLSQPDAGSESAPVLNAPWTEPPPAQDAAASTSQTPAWLNDDVVRNADGALSLPGGDAAPVQSQPAPMPAAPPQAPPPEPPARARFREGLGGAAATAGQTAPADATAFAPKKLRRSAPELVQVTIHQPKDLQAVIKAARKTNPGTEPAPQGVRIGDVALGASIGVALETRGASCDGALQRRPWTGDPIEFAFVVEADASEKKAILIARVFIDDAQIGTIAFTRPISGPAKKPASAGDGARLKRHKRVFLSYSSKDRETVAAIATAYQSAGVEHFWDRASLKSGEEWSPRLRKEIERADLFHLCWSKSAAASEWVEKETEHALTRRKRSNGKNPDITVQMLDGPPWAPHPANLDSINFDDFVRAAIVGYARGDGS